MNDTFFHVSRPDFRKSFPEYYNSSLLELIYSKCLMLSNLKLFKMPTFLLFASDWGAWREEICEADKTEFFLFVESHSHLAAGTKKWNVSSLNFCSSGKNLGCVPNWPWHIPRRGLYYCWVMCKAATPSTPSLQKQEKERNWEMDLETSEFRLNTVLKPLLFQSAW